MIEIQYFKTPYGELILGSFENKLCLCDWRYRKMRESLDKRIQSRLNSHYVERDNDLLKLTRLQFQQYFHSERVSFDLPLLLVGTEFQKTVWHALMSIPFGETATYLNLAEKIENKSAVRAVANANGANAISIIVPCHRIIGSNGKLVGYAGGLETKRKLLLLEQDMFAPNRQC
ncbi:methylated-DNA--[protein]-cysteine S-methyltransferase [Vibrio sp. 99-8-1]|uniref:methylated-DNA--[protein]-cysteine S-methyltransferase n=1 Tax=Vibrio sp. 99-8-1 TaxID=2607602 RepID=UPI001493C76F|nr:methylated-DNA--[protein]-cysteine S-methyltransferase [Vibrio sp. 99-8-1]NOI66063.1 methylated-DNA--[protein]-cysteine S-methyltransferase [Vibrio sp. 99-8-1]